MSKRTVVLNNGIEMPILGLGTYILSSSQAEESVYAAFMAGMASIKPAVLQNETHPYYQERGPKAAAAESGTVLESWFPLGGKQDCHTLFADSVISEVAASHGVSPAQALIRWHLQTGNVCIPGSSNPDHIREDANVWDFELAADEMESIDALETGRRLAWY